jgi:hypothetical protein
MGLRAPGLVLLALPSLVAAALWAPPASAAPPRVRVAWPEASWAVVRPGERLTVRVRVAGGPRARRPLADVALLALTRSGRPRARLALRRARAATLRLQVPRGASGPVRLRVRVAGRSLSRRFVAAPARVPVRPPSAPGGGPGAPPAVAGPACDDAAVGSAVATAGAPAAAPPGGTVGMLVTNTGVTCLSGGVCPSLEVQADDGSWVEALDDERPCIAVAVTLAPGASRRFDFALPPDVPPGALYRLTLLLAGPEATLEATTPVEVLPPA